MIKPLFPIDDSGLETAIDEIINYKPKEKPKAEVKEEEPTLPQQINKAKRDYWALKVLGGIVGGFVGLCGLLYGLMRIPKEYKTEIYSGTQSVSQIVVNGFWDEHKLRLNEDGSMQMDLYNGDEGACSLLNLPNNTLVDRIKRGNQIYERGSAPEIVFAEADATWNEYFGEFDVNEMKRQWEAEKQRDELQKVFEGRQDD